MPRQATHVRFASALVALLLLALVVPSPVAADAAPASAPSGAVLGKGVGDAKLVPIADLLEDPAAFVGKTIRVEGTVTEVCQRRGCWMDLAGDRAGAMIRIKVDDGVIVFPKEAKGRQALAEGVFTKIEQTREEALASAKHAAEEKGQKYDPAKHVATVTYQIRGTGAVIR